MSTPPHLIVRWRSKPAHSLAAYPRPRLINASFVLATFVTILFAVEIIRKAARFYSFSTVLSRPSNVGENITSLLSPPTHAALREWEAQLPQHNLSLPFPEGRNGRYVLFSNSRANRLGWNNKLNEMLMNTWLAHESNRGYVFHDFAWQDHHYPWPIDQSKGWVPYTPLNALISGPPAGGAWEKGDPSPRAISEKWFDIVCPQHERRIINTRDVKPDIYWEDGKVIFGRWKAMLTEAPERCIEVVPASAEEDPFPETFDIMFWSGDRGLSLWEDFVKSPVSRLVQTSPIVQAAVEANQHRFVPKKSRRPFKFIDAAHIERTNEPFENVLALHIRRGDFKQACLEYAAQNLSFYSWNLLPSFSDGFIRPSLNPHHPERSIADTQAAYLERCLPTAAYIAKKVRTVRRDYMRASPKRRKAPLDVLFIMSNDKTAWLNDLKANLLKDGWSTVVTSRDLQLDAEQKEVSVAVDMDLGRRAAVFVGNGWSSFTSNVVHRRLVDGKEPISIRFW